MINIKIADTTLCREENSFSFKEKIEIARQLDMLQVDIIELPPVLNEKTDILLVRTLSAFIKKNIISVGAGLTQESIELAAEALSAAENPRIRIELPVSPVGMEYTCHIKPPKMLEHIKICVKLAKEKCADVEFAAVDATRAEPGFLKSAITEAINAGAGSISLYDSASKLLPDDFASFVENYTKDISVPVGILCDNTNGFACAQAVSAAKIGVSTIKASVDGNILDLAVFAQMVKNCGNDFGIATNLKYTELTRNINQIKWISGNARSEKKAVTVASTAESFDKLDKDDSIEEVSAAIGKLGYDLSEEDIKRVYEEFSRVAEKKSVAAKELEAIVASVALQVPPTYKLISYVINSGNVINSSAQITLEKDSEQMQGICIGDGPIDAAFLAINRIIGCHYELDDFQIQSVTEGKEAMGSALVRLRSAGKLYSGNGISTDIIGASIRAYLNAVNKIVYEEA